MALVAPLTVIFPALTSMVTTFFPSLSLTVITWSLSLSVTIKPCLLRITLSVGEALTPLLSVGVWPSPQYPPDQIVVGGVSRLEHHPNTGPGFGDELSAHSRPASGRHGNAQTAASPMTAGTCTFKRARPVESSFSTTVPRYLPKNRLSRASTTSSTWLGEFMVRKCGLGHRARRDRPCHLSAAVSCRGAGRIMRRNVDLLMNDRRH